MDSNLTSTYRIIPYDEAHAASERGERVEMRWMNCHCSLPHEWRVFSQEVIDEQPEDSIYEFRVLDPYAELKAAQAEGKVIQFDSGSDEWHVDINPLWTFPPERYRAIDCPKPDELVIEPGKEYRTRSGMRAIIYATSQPGQYPIHGAIFYPNECDSASWTASGKYIATTETGDPEDLIAPWTDTPAPYDNWDKVPAWAMWQAMDESGSWIFAENKPTQLGSVWGCDSGPNDLETGFGSLPKHLYPTNFTGTWEQSLQRRPTK